MEILNNERPLFMELKHAITEICGDKIAKLALYGSRARGDYDRDSDIDIAIVVKGLTRELKNRILDTVCDVELKYSIPLSTIVFSEEDFEFLKKRERRIALDIEREGISL